MKVFKGLFLCFIASILNQGGYLGAQNARQGISVNDYILQYRDLAIQKMKIYRIPASIILGQGILESANGNSELAIFANNHFGVKCHNDWKGDTYYKDDEQKGECFRKYRTVDESYEDHSVFLSSRDRYAALFKLDPLDYKAWAKGLKDAGYATNPDYIRLLIKVIEDNRLYELDGGVLPLADIRQAKGKVSKGRAGADSFEPILVGGPAREVLLNNGVQFTYARSGDDFDKISKAMDVMPWQLRRYNDIDQNHKFVAGEIIYLKPKKRKAQTDYHIVNMGEEMRDIAQRYAMKLKLLYRRNHMEPGSQPRAGEKLWLRKTKP